MRSLMLPFVVAAGLAGCSTPRAPAPAPVQPPAPPVQPAPVALPKPKLPHYRCDGPVEFDVRFDDDSAQLLFVGREPETLLRDAGGTTPQQTVYSSTKLKAEFGLDPSGRGAQLSFASPPVAARCLRD